MQEEMKTRQYVEVNGRKILLRPKVNLEIDENGYYRRQKNRFTEHFGTKLHPIEKDRYILFWSKGCAWSNRVVIVITLLGLEETIKTEVVDWSENEDLGWEFVNSPSHINAETGAQFLSELYYNTDPEYLGRTTVPAIVDYKTNTIVNNDFRFLTNYLETEFREYHMENAPDLYPYELRKQIDDMNEWLYVNVNDAIYRACFANSVEAYNEGYNTFFSALDILDNRLSEQRFLLGDYVMDSDIRLYSTLVRMDLNYLRHIGPSKRRLVDYKNLWEYCRELYQIPAFSSNTYFRELAAVGDKRFKFNPYYDMVVPKTDYEKIWSDPTNRCALSKRDKGIFLKEGRFS